jgi:hypothetical protein
VTGLPIGKSRLDVAFERLAGGLRMRFGLRGSACELEVLPMLPPGARNLRARLDGAAIAPRPSLGVRLTGEPRLLELRWDGGYALEPRAVVLEPGQADAGVRILDVAEDAQGLRVEVEGQAGSTATLRLWGERAARAEGATLRDASGALELDVPLPASVSERFSRATVHLRSR